MGWLVPGQCGEPGEAEGAGEGIGDCSVGAGWGSRAGGDSLGKERVRKGGEKGGFAGMFGLGKAAFIRTGPAWCQCWYRMCGGSRETGSLWGEPWPQPFALGVGSRF